MTLSDLNEPIFNERAELKNNSFDEPSISKFVINIFFSSNERNVSFDLNSHFLN